MAIVEVKPFLKWAGGKTWLLKNIKETLPKNYNNYHEPFLGGGATFFSIKPKNQAFLSDTNQELINCYKQVKSVPKEVLSHLGSFENSEKTFYRIRAQTNYDKSFSAARFIYLNKTCFNGLYRVNAKGFFNVPYGKDPKRVFFKEDEIVLASRRLRKAKLEVADFDRSRDKIERGDFVFLDPPYTVAHKNNGFIEYNKNLFTWEDQQRLAEFVNHIRKKGAYYLLTNASHKSIYSLYKSLGKIVEIDRLSTISGIIEKRKLTSEYMISNCIS